MIDIVLSKNTWIGAAFAAALVGGWAVTWYGPGQYRAGGLEKAAELDAATKKAAGEIQDDAERFRFKLEHCRQSGRVFDYATGECES